jgi:SulP family sulfate permease
MDSTRYAGESETAPLRDLPAAALRAVWRAGYGRKDCYHDLMAGLVVGIVALPLSMALAIGVGVAPQHGLYTAIVAGLVVPLFGGSRTQVSGPTAAFIVVLAPIYWRYGMPGLLLAGLMAGVLLLAMGLMRLGRLIQFIPHPVTTGFTAGIALVIAILQLKSFFGLTLLQTPAHFPAQLGAIVQALPTATLGDTLLGFLTLSLLIATPRLTRRLPAALVALPLAALAKVMLEQADFSFEISTLASTFQTELAGRIHAGIPALPPAFVLPWNLPDLSGQHLPLSFALLRELLPAAFAIAMLAAIESLLSAVIADGMTRTRHDPDAELLALGLGNILVPFFAGIPATGAIARTATSIRAGARSPIAAIVHAFVVLSAMLALAPLLGHIPMAALAALLLQVAWRMSEAKHFFHTLRVAPKSDATVLLACFSLTVFFDMVVGVTAGMVLASFLFMRRMAEVTHARLSVDHHPDLPGMVPRGVSFYEISGPLFFGAAQKAMARLMGIDSSTKVLILLMDEVQAMDATGLVALESALESLRHLPCRVILSGVRKQPLSLLDKAGLTKRADLALAATPTEAVALAQTLLGEQQPVP